MIDGMYSKSGALSQAAAAIVRQAISAMQREADIHSPSKKTRDLIGKPLAQGVAVGFDRQMAEVGRAIRGTMAGEFARMSADTKLQAERQAAQSSPVPVQMHYQREVIEKTPSLSFKGDVAGLMRFLYPYWEVEHKRRGKSMVKGGAT